MSDTHHPKKARKAVGLLPNRIIILVVSVLCLGLTSTTVFTFTTLLRLRSIYLSSRGHEIAASIENQARGPGKRNNPAFWQSLLEEAYETYSDSVAFLALIDQTGHTLASREIPPSGPSGFAATHSNDIFIFEETLGRSSNRRPEAVADVSGWRLRIGLYSMDADFIRRQAYTQIVISGLAIITLLALSLYLMRMLNRYLELKAQEASEAQLKSLGIMAASLAHEIRNPLGAMKGLTQLSQEDLPSDHVAQARLRTVVAEAERLERLVTDLLDFARPPDLKVREFNLKDLISDVQNMLEARLETSDVTLQYDLGPGPLRIRSDPEGLRQVLLNVLINAVDETPAGGKVLLRTVDDEANNSIIIQVDDIGQGLGERNPEELFQPFVTTKARGTGLGLTISRRIIEGLEGSLTLGNNPRGGMRCTIQLRASKGLK